MKHFLHLGDKEIGDRMPSNITQKTKSQKRDTERHSRIDDGTLRGGLLKWLGNHCG